MSKDSLATTLHQWERLLAAWAANPGDLDHLEAERAELQELADRLQRLQIQQDALNAMKQQVTRDLDATKERGRKLAVRMRDGVRSRYGLFSEKLIEFGLRPRRGRVRPAENDPSTK